MVGMPRGRGPGSRPSDPERAYPCGMAMRVELPDDVAARIAELARARGVSPDQVAAEVLGAHLPRRPKRPLTFIGLGRSGRHDLSERAKEIRRAEFGA